MKKLLDLLRDLFRNAASACWELYKVMIPIIIGVRILQEFDLIQYLAWPLRPVMGLVGLPAEMGLAWATAMVNNIYSGLIVFLSLIKDTPLTTAQATVLGVLFLVAHGLPVESSIARKAGSRFLFQCLSRIIGALCLGWLLHTIYTAAGTLEQPAVVLFQASAQTETSLTTWALGELRNLLGIFGIVFCLMALMRLLHALRIVDLLNAILRPVLKLIGIGPKASAITVIGLTLGLTYGGGLIISEAKSGTVGRQDVFYSLTLMGLCHSLIEDTLLLALIGAHFSGIFWGRFGFSIMAVAVLVQIVRKLPEKFCDKYLWGDPA
ncbi:hypothetical protein [Pseudodesulfovibrio tunisiensis]|uniref:hypothetical protein n=1 Tax=Pseudodesulfovibrio tunisiensis TaxID=463192 RepID=UPI001FB52731|nr:hypothetical protein [Pseudodesulfovibrio tunisiensis]